MQWGAAGGGGKVPDLLPGAVGTRNQTDGLNGYHQVGHYTQGFYKNGPTLANGTPTLTPEQQHYPELKKKLMAFYGKEMATFLGYLRDMREGAGTVADNTVVLWTNSMAYGGHGYQSPGIPNVIFAGKNVLPSTKTGTYHKYTNREDGARLMVSLSQMMGLKDVTKFGAPQYGDAGPLPGLI